MVFAKYIFITFLLTSSLGSFAFAVDKCQDLFIDRVLSYSNAKVSLIHDVNDMDASLMKLNVDWKEIKLRKKIGYGASGVVYEATFRGKNVAVKLIRNEHNLNGESNEIRGSVMIQKVLGELNLTPKVIGVVSGAQLDIQYRNGIALIMELVDTSNQLKVSTGNKITATHYALLLREAKQIESALSYLQVLPIDADGYIDAEGHLKIIDTSFYRYRPNYTGNISFYEQIKKHLYKNFIIVDQPQLSNKLRVAI
ncbi:MAG: protein kinase [Bdellovibrionaceae bacterium]|nr:protein kinase [Bdellovibrio sp.]